MQHTYLRYECADAFAVASSAATTSTLTTSPLTFLNSSFDSAPKKNNSASLLLSAAGSQIIGFNLRTNEPCIKIAHRELLSGGLGTGRALNSNEVLCITTACSTPGNSAKNSTKVASGWKDGSIRLFDIKKSDVETKNSQNIEKPGLAHSLIFESTSKQEEFIMREPLVLNGHSNSPITCLKFDNTNGHASRLASGSTDGVIILWDIIAEEGLFRLLGHKAPISDLSFISSSELKNCLVSSSHDGLVKIWDLDAQCCTQTIANHGGQVLCSTVVSRPSDDLKNGDEDENDKKLRSRLVTGCIDGKVRVWSIQPSKRMENKVTGSPDTNTEEVLKNTQMQAEIATSATTTPSQNNEQDDVCHYMGTLTYPPNVVSSNEKVQSLQFHPSGKYLAYLRSNSKNIDVYELRNEEEVSKKRSRRLRRRREKENKNQVDDSNSNHKDKGKKRGILDDEEDLGETNSDPTASHTIIDHDEIKASDEFEYATTIRASHKVKAFTFVPYYEKNGGIRILTSLATNAFEVHSMTINELSSDSPADTPKFKTSIVSSLDMYGHPTGIRSIALSSDDVLACTVSKNSAKVWNVNNRSCLRSLSLEYKNASSKKANYYGLCATFLPGDTHFVVGTREGHLLIVDIASGEIVYMEEKAHEKEIWSIDIKKPSTNIMNPDDNEAITVMTGSADKSVKFWELEIQNDDDNETQFSNHPMLTHVRTLQSNDDVVAARYSHDASKRLVFVSTLDSQIKVFFDDSLKFFLSLYGHSLPALALDASDDDALLASGGADKSIKIWGLDFGDTHRTLYGHSDSITDLRFVKKTHNFFTCSKDTTVRYWDGDRFEQILLLNGHMSEINCLALSKTGAFVLSCGMDRQVRVWERTQDMVFLEEEKEREIEANFEKINGGDEVATERVLRRRQQSGGEADNGDDDDDDDDNAPQSAAAVRKSVLSVSSGDRIMEALELADQEIKEKLAFNRSQEVKNKEDRKKRTPSILLLGMEPPDYVLWVLRTVKSSELEQSLLILPLSHMERLIYYLIVLLRKGHGVELCSRVAIFLIKTHQNQLIYGGSGRAGSTGNKSNISVPLRELRRLLKDRLSESRDTIGYNLAAMRMVLRISRENKNQYHIQDNESSGEDVWKNLGRLV